MTVAVRLAPEEEPRPPLEVYARELAETQQPIARAARLVTQIFEPPQMARPLERVQKHFGAKTATNPAIAKASEWFLDNYYLIRRVARQVEEELPRGFVQHLPQLTLGEEKGRPRIDPLARALLDHTELIVDQAVLRRFIEAYQEVAPLTIAELWALPTVLRAIVLQHLLHFLDALEMPVHERERRAGHHPLERLALDAGTGVERAIRALRVFDALDWKVFFEKTSHVEAILRTDPAQTYGQMDFATCDSYRKVIERLAWATGRPEEEVAELAATLARGEDGDDRRGHVGYFLVGGGLEILERALEYRPVGLDFWRRAVTRRPTLSYLLPLSVLSGLPLLALALALDQTGAAIAAALLAAVVPVSAAASALIHFAFALLLPPRTLPKLDFKQGLPSGTRTLVVMPTLLGRASDVDAMLRRIELHYLSNPDPELRFALLTDDVDAESLEQVAARSELLESAARGIAALNARHPDGAGQGPFHLLHRHPKWNPSEGRYMGWERKRGKLEELNLWLRGDEDTSYSLHVGEPEGLNDVRFVITLDSDTELPMGSARRLVGLLAHPLNQAVFDPSSGRVLEGYTIVQPRVETSPSSARPTHFSKIFAGDIGYDIYTHASSELYQDLFGAGIYVGKGIYDVDAFVRSVENRVPENALVSHDLFEGIHGRTALATDIVLFEDYPPNYATYALRLHRWIRGDWQLLPWLFPRVPDASGKKVPNTLAAIDRWKIVDNLRRSLISPCLLIFFALGWLALPGSPLFWTLGALLTLLAPLLQSLAPSGPRRREHLVRFGLAIVFLAYEAAVVLDAIARVAVRKLISHRRLLEWTSAAHAGFRLEARSPRAIYWRTMAASPLIAVGLAILITLLRPEALWAAAPILALWLLAPEAARRVSEPRRHRRETLEEDELRKLRRLARRTWRFFDVFVGPNDQWLPIDNYQEDPREQTAHRTSPTNIGLMLTATLSAYDFGYLGPSEFSLRIGRAMESIKRLVHYQGHLLNWYDTKNLLPLLPRYVSTVDSGNFAGCLLALKQGCRELVSAPVVRRAAWDGLRDTIELLDEVVRTLPSGVPASLRAVIDEMLGAAHHAHAHLDETYAILTTLTDETSRALDRELLALLEAGLHRHEADLLRALRRAIDQLHQHLGQMRRELDTLLPWLALRTEAKTLGLELPLELRLDEIPAAAERLSNLLSAQPDPANVRLHAAFRSGSANATALIETLHALAASADEEMRGMDFGLLYDPERRLFHIGYNATIDQIDGHYYDLMASEARLASYLAIVKRDVPESHWYALGRPMSDIAGGPALLSWGGTMFEYLMPDLLMRSQADTLLARTSVRAVDAQIAHGKALDRPWGVSESAYARLDAEQTYQYRAFGVPGLGFKRGLEEDEVVTPYASLLAVALRPRAVVDNLTRLEAMGMLGTYGFFEALDLTPERAAEQAPIDQPYAIVRSYMAHHQGMILIALGNFLTERSMVQRFFSDALVETGEILLNEHAPHRAPGEWPIAEASKVSGPLAPAAPPAPWTSPERQTPQAFVLSNGRLSSWLTSAGGGGLRWQRLALTHYEPDPSRDDDGLWFYVRDEDSGLTWRATSNEGRTTFALHQVSFHRRSDGISVHLDVTVAAADDVEVRQITIHNETDRPRQISITSAGRPVLFDAGRAPSHPAFSSLFVESEALPEFDGLLFGRRPQATDEEPVVLIHRLVREGRAVRFGGFESDRAAFYGRGGNSAPQALAGAANELFGAVGTRIDPIMSLMARVTLEAKGSATLAFVTAVGRSRGAALELGKKYGSMHAVRWAFRDAEQAGPRRLLRNKLDAPLLPAVQRLFSALHFADPALRAPLEARAATLVGQRNLWGRGISGDDPLVVLRVRDPADAAISELIVAQRFLRSCGVRFDLVLIDEQPSGYVTAGPGTLRGLLVQHEVETWIDRRGGIFLVIADQTAAPDLKHLEACARVLLDSREGSLNSRFERFEGGPPKLPRFEPTGAEITPDRAPEKIARRLDNGIGGFSADGREYRIEVGAGQETPAPWCNVIANSQFGCLVSESSFGFSWSQNSGENRLTPWRNDPVFDLPSETLYLRDEETAAVWSTTPYPAGRGTQTVIRHGAGYTTYERESHGLAQELTVFVPPDAPLKIVRLRLRNTQPRHRRLTATYYAEWVLGRRRELQRPFIQCEYEREQSALLARCDWSQEFAGRVAFLAAAEKVHGFSTDRGEFLGRRGDYALPEALERWGLSGRTDPGADPCAALQVHLDLAAGGEIETHFILGQAANREEALRQIALYREPAAVAPAFRALEAFWDGILGQIQVRTPEPAMDLMLNRWLLYQSLSARIFGRTGFYQSSGAFGYRDQLQDVLALLHGAPAIARAQILEAARHQFEEGDVLHWWHPPAGRGVRTRCSDDLAWLPYVTGDYVAATGDVAILDEPLTFLTGPELAVSEHDRYAEYPRSAESAPLYEHCRRALERAITDGEHGLPLMGDGDWNDGMNRIGAKGRGESVWLGWFLCATMERFADLAAHKQEDAAAVKWRARAQLLRTRIRDVAWDGAWFLRAYHDDGSAVGSASSRECRIDSIAQSWSVLAGGPRDRDEPRTRAAVLAADEQLVREDDRLVLLFWPPYDSTLHDPGYVRAYPPGVRENGGQYTHAATWLGFAHAALGDGARAERIFRLLNPALRVTTPAAVARYRVEPYVLAGDVYSCPPWAGRGGWTWYTGAASWLWRLGVEAILGLRKKSGQLQIDPCIPPEWPGFEAWVQLGEQKLHVVVENPERVASGVSLLTLDGLPQGPGGLSLTGPGSHEILVRLGARTEPPA